jgi:threonine/homoserine/homoserine lactone efflux protein
MRLPIPPSPTTATLATVRSFPIVSLGQLLPFIGVSLVVIVTPGQDTALTVRNTLTGGRRGGVLTALGVVSGQLTWALAASAGLSALLLASRPLFIGLRLAGAAYLVFLGAQALVAAMRGRSHHGTGGRRSPAYREGVLSNLGNPKMVVFFTSLLPQFAASFGGMLALGAAFASLTLAWLSLYALAVAQAKAVLLRTRVRRALDAVAGLVLVAFGLRLATEA